MNRNIQDYYTDGCPIVCPTCGCANIKECVKDTINHIVCEVEYVCLTCDKIVGYWASLMEPLILPTNLFGVKRIKNYNFGKVYIADSTPF